MKKLLALLLTLIFTFSCFSILGVGTVSAETQKVGQVILESDFNDADGTNWQMSTGAVTYSDDNGDGVNDYASVKISSTNKGVGLFSAPFNLIPGNEYELTYYIRVPKESASFYLESEKVFYAPSTALYQPKVNSTGTKVSSVPIIATVEASNNYYAYSYTDDADATKNWARRSGFTATWTIDGYEPTVKSNFSNFSYSDHKAVLSATNADLNTAFANWTKVTVNFTAMAAAEGETSQVTALGFTFHDYRSSNNMMFDLKDIKLVCTDNGLTPKTIMTSDFNDSDGTNWRYTSNDVTYCDDNGDGVNDYASVKINANNQNAGLFSTPFNLVPGNDYELTYYIRVPEESRSFLIGSTFYAPTVAFYQPKVNSTGTKIENVPAVSTVEATNNFYAYRYTNTDDPTQNWSRREGFEATWTIDGYTPKVITNFSDFDYRYYTAVLGATNADLNEAFEDWTKVTVNFTALANTEDEKSQVTAVGFYYGNYKSSDNFVFDLKDVVLTETSLQPETPEEPETPEYKEPVAPEGAVYYESFEDDTDDSVAAFVQNASTVKLSDTDYASGYKSLAISGSGKFLFIPIDTTNFTPGTTYELSMDWKLPETSQITHLMFVGYNGETLDSKFVKTSNVYTYKANSNYTDKTISGTGNWQNVTLRFGNSNYTDHNQYGILLRYISDTLYLDNLAVAPAKEETVKKITLTEEERTDDTIKVLAFGNSFSSDSIAWLTHIAKEDGKDLRVANCAIGGCSLGRHYSNIFNGSSDKYNFTYYTKAHDIKTYSNTSMQEALMATDWDYITLQQASGESYKYDSYEPYLTELITYIKTFNPNVKILFNETWAYPDESHMFIGQSAFDTDGDGNSEEAAMFEKVREAYLTASQNHGFTPLIPVGEAILRARDELDRNLSRDGHHLDDRGRLIAALMWYEMFTGVSALDNKVDLTDNSTFVFSYSTTAITGASDINGYNGVEYKGTGLNITAEEQQIMKTIAHETVELYKKANETQKAIEAIGEVNADSGEAIETAEALRTELNNDILLPNLQTLLDARAAYDSLVPEEVIGDFDGTGVADLEDVTLLARHFAGWDSDLDEAVLDLNGDGVQNLKDLVLLAQYVAGWDVKDKIVK